MLYILIAVVFFALVFDLINGFHDAANSIATIVSTRVLTPVQAVIWAAMFNFLAFWIFDLKVADTVAKTVHSGEIDLLVVLAGVLGGIIWNLITWWLGIPSSSSHTLMGGFAGAAVAHTASFSVINTGVIEKTVLFIFLAPVIGMIIGLIMGVLITYIFKKTNPYKADKWFRRLQLVSSAAFSLGHGGSDSQKVIGIIAAALIVYQKYCVANGIEAPSLLSIQEGHLNDIPQWIPITCYITIALGTLIGGWRIVKTMGTKITKVTPFEGVAAESAGAITLYGVSQGLGIPVSTTHTISGSIMGTGMLKRISAVRWGVTRQMLIAWILTIPMSALIAAIVYYLLKIFL
ncbi:MAG: inorganic phosphate transporter [Chitinophagaceae bacterium]